MSLAKNLLRATMMIAVAGGSFAAHAATITVEAADLTAGKMVITGTEPGAASTSGNVSYSYVGAAGTSTAGDVINISAQGVPLNPGLSTTTIDAVGNPGTTLSIIITEQGLVASDASIPMTVSYTLNALTAGSAGSVMYADYVSASNALFDTSSSDLLTSTTLVGSSTPNQYVSNQTATGLTPGSLYSVTEMLNLTFGASGSLTASSQLVPVASVPEPATLALLGLPLALLGLLGMRRRQDAAKA